MVVHTHMTTPHPYTLCRGQLEVLEFHNTELQVELHACRQELAVSEATANDLCTQLQQSTATRGNTDTLCTLRTISAALARGEAGELETWHRAVELLRGQLEATVGCMHVCNCVIVLSYSMAGILPLRRSSCKRLKRV